jgi:hypothetical protein
LSRRMQGSVVSMTILNRDRSANVFFVIFDSLTILFGNDNVIR